MDTEDEYAEEIAKHIELEDIVAEPKEQLPQKVVLIVTLIKTCSLKAIPLLSISQTHKSSETQIFELLSK